MSRIFTEANWLDRPAPPVLPPPAERYSQQYQDQLNNILRLYFGKMNSMFQQLGVAKSGAFSRTTSQTAALANTAYPILFNNTRITNGVIIGTPTSRIVVPQSGLYEVLCSAQYTSTNAAQKNVYTWIRKNGVDIVQSSRITTLAATGAYSSVLLSESVSLNAGDYIEIVFATTDITAQLVAAPATAFSPGSPAANMDIVLVKQ